MREVIEPVQACAVEDRHKNLAMYRQEGWPAPLRAAHRQFATALHEWRLTLPFDEDETNGWRMFGGPWLPATFRGALATQPLHIVARAIDAGVGEPSLRRIAETLRQWANANEHARYELSRVRSVCDEVAGETVRLLQEKGSAECEHG